MSKQTDRLEKESKKRIIILTTALSVGMLIVFAILLSWISDAPITLFISQNFHLGSFLLETLGFILAMIFAWLHYKKSDLSSTIAFFLPIFLIAAFLEGDWIRRGIFEYHNFNISIWNTPLVIVFFWALFYLMKILYNKFGNSPSAYVKGATTHMLIDALIATPIGIASGFWTIRYTVFNSYPYIAPIVHIGEISIVLLYIIGQRRLNKMLPRNDYKKPVMALFSVFCILAVYSIIMNFI